MEPERYHNICHFANNLAQKFARYLAYPSSMDQLGGAEEARKLALIGSACFNFIPTRMNAG